VIASEATLTVGRELFLPDTIWIPAAGGYRAVTRQDEPETWLAAASADEPVVTQVDDGATMPGQLGQRSSCSSSQPSLVSAMLDAASLAPGMRVLEIGTGTGWTAALLCERLGADAVTTIEVDPTLAGQARAALDRAGYHPAVMPGDGAAGQAGRAPYDRILATCAVGQVPYPWVEQTRPGGQILAPWGTEYHNGALARLTVHSDGTASGHFAAVVLAFMRLRAQRTAPCPWDSDGPGTPDYGRTQLPSDQIYELIASPGAFAVGLHLPSCHKLVDEDHLVVRLHDPDTGSWARCEVTPGASSHPVAQHGPRQLWTEAERAHTWWVDHGRPALTRFGLTVTADDQRVWLDDPTHIVATAVDLGFGALA
jgi:protein-L-isoaspartate(D-aspartate) O-methyltransferase